MLVEFRDGDRLLGVKALAIYRKGIEAAKAACDKVYVETLALDVRGGKAEATEQWLFDALDEMGVGEVRECDLPLESALALRLACSVYLVQLGKLSEKQTDLLVPLDETNEVMSHLQSLTDRLRGQLELAGIADALSGTHTRTIVDGDTTMTISGVSGSFADAFERAAKDKKK